MRVQIRDAFLLATTQQCPVVVAAPMDLQNERWNESLEDLPTTRELTPKFSPPVPDAASLNKAAARIDGANRIIIIAGLGAVKSDAGPACIQLAGKLGALLATTLPARGLFYQDDYSIGVAGGFSGTVARCCLQQADLIIAVGSSLASHTSDAGKLFSADNVLHIDLQPRTISQGREAAKYHLCCDAKSGIEALNQVLEQRETSDERYWRSDTIAAVIRDTPADDQEFAIEPGLLDPRDVVTVLDDLIPQDWYTVNSSGHCSCFFAQMNKRPADRFLTIREFGAIGNGLSFAMGVAAARPKEPVVLFDGDGSLLMHIQELETIIRHNMSIMIVVMNDGAYGSEVHKLRAEGLAEHGAVFGRPNFASIAEGYGAAGYTVKMLDDIPALIEKFNNQCNKVAVSADNSRVSVIDVHVSDKVVSSVMRRAHLHK